MQARTEPAVPSVTRSAVTDTPPAVTAVAVTRKTRVGWNPDRIRSNAAPTVGTTGSVSSASMVVKDTATATSTSLQSAGAATTDSTTAAVTAESVTDKRATLDRVTADSVTGDIVSAAAPARKTNTKVRPPRVMFCKREQTKCQSEVLPRADLKYLIFLDLP
jgi:hypothetical protein